MDDPLLPTEEFQARVLAGRALAERGDFQGAETCFRGLLAEARDRHPGNHARALASLAVLYGRGGRYLEAHLLASRLASLARAVGGAADGTLAFALAKICGALSQLRVPEALGEALEELRDVLDRAPQPLLNLELEYHVAAGAHASAAGDVPRARRHIEAYRKTIEGIRIPEAVYRWALTMADSRVLLLEGRAAEARGMALRLGRDIPTPAFARLHGLVLQVEVHEALGEREDALRAGREAVDLLASVKESSFLAADYIHQGGLLARAFDRLGEVELAHRTYDLLAAAVLVNLRQVDECMRALPELGLADAESQAVLGRFRKQFLREQKELLARVAGMLGRQEGDRVRGLLSHPAAAGFISICAWCESVRSPEGAWLPIGHYVPRSGTLQVTHGICPPCATCLTAPR